MTTYKAPQISSKKIQGRLRYLLFYLKIIYNQPTVKKLSLNTEDLSNYRSIVNLSFISKLTETIFKKRLLDHLTSNSLLNPFQSAYTKFYSPRPYYFPYINIFLTLSLSNKSLASVFLIYLPPLTLLITPSCSIIFLPGSAFPLFRYIGSLHISHSAHLL